MNPSDFVLRSKRTVEDLWPMVNRRVLVRVDFNVPIRKGDIRDDGRIREALRTVRHITENGGICILMSHLGRPKGVSLQSLLKMSRERKEKILQTWALECGTGKTTFFTLLSSEVKRKILLQSSLKQEAERLPSNNNKSPTKDRESPTNLADDNKLQQQSSQSSPGIFSPDVELFAQLPEEEKKMLLDAYSRHLQHQQSRFPQLRQYKGFEEELSLRPVAVRLSELLQQDVIFAPDCLDAKDLVMQLKPGDVMLLENIRFYSDESATDPIRREAMAAILADYADYFVCDAFGASHREAATMTGIPRLLGHGCAGYLMEREVEHFSKVLGEEKLTPVVAIIGGTKVSDKILLLQNMLTRIDKLIIGGAMSYTFLKAQGRSIGKSFCEAGQSFKDIYKENLTGNGNGSSSSNSNSNYSKDNADNAVEKKLIEQALALLRQAKERNVDVYLPVDHICHTECEATSNPYITDGQDIPEDLMALDIGPKTIERFTSVITGAKAVIWSGPLGVFEIPAYADGSLAMAKTIGELTKTDGLLSIIGGGDSAVVVESAGETERMSHVSMGGGASLELLEGKELPGLAVLDDKPQIPKGKK